MPSVRDCSAFNVCANFSPLAEAKQYYYGGQRLLMLFCRDSSACKYQIGVSLDCVLAQHLVLKTAVCVDGLSFIKSSLVDFHMGLGQNFQQFLK